MQPGTRKGLLHYGILLGGIFLLIQGFLMHVTSPGPRSDLDILLTAGDRFAQSQSVYRLEDIGEHTKPPLLSPALALLSSLPRDSVRTAWDLLTWSLPLIVLLVFFGSPSAKELLSKNHFWIAAAGSLVVLRGAWRAEMDFGQFNLLTLLLTILAARNISQGRSLRGGLLFLPSLLLKPTQLFFLPWLLMPIKKPQPQIQMMIRFGAGLLGSTLIFATLFSIYRPLPELWSAHLEWIHFLRDSTQKHILRTDNWGLPSLLARHGYSWATSSALPLLSIIALGALVRKWKNSPEVVFHISAVLSLMLSPMTWTQNFSILLPLAFTLSRWALTGKSRMWATAGCLVMLIPNAIKPAWLNTTLQAFWSDFSIPLLTACFAVGIACVLSRLNSNDSGAST